MATWTRTPRRVPPGQVLWPEATGEHSEALSSGDYPFMAQAPSSSGMQGVPGEPKIPVDYHRAPGSEDDPGPRAEPISARGQQANLRASSGPAQGNPVSRDPGLEGLSVEGRGLRILSDWPTTAAPTIAIHRTPAAQYYLDV